ncbi:MAG TPA: YraN family protein [bacterium]|nr:YraN family protein [bacterium]
MKTSPFRLSLGQRGEMIGWSYLLKKGYRILEKNYRCPLGEIDVIAMKGRRVVFIEIKTRSHARFGRPEEAVHAAKQKKLIQLALWYMKQKKMEETPCAFDVLAITLKDHEDPEIHLLEDAFTADPT